MGQHDTFGIAGCTGRINHNGGIIIIRFFNSQDIRSLLNDFVKGQRLIWSRSAQHNYFLQLWRLFAGGFYIFQIINVTD